MAHGYLGDGYGIHGEEGDRDSDRERGWREHDRDWRGRGDDWRERDRDRGMMFGRHDRDWSDEDRWSNRGSGERFGREHGQGESRGEYSEPRRSFTAHPDDHYRSWRDRHMSELDRDYQDYCREREQAFHQEFDAWRQQRHGDYQPLRTGMTNSGMSHDPSGQVQVETEGMTTHTDPTGAATLGTNTGQTEGARRRR